MPENFEKFTLTTGGEEEQIILGRRDAFFAQVLSELGLATANPFTEAASKRLGWEYEGEFYPSDDMLHTLMVFDELVAMVMDRRNQGNNHEVTFWQNNPSAQCLESIRRTKQ